MRKAIFACLIAFLAMGFFNPAVRGDGSAGCDDFVNGGGQIITLSGGLGTFGFIAGTFDDLVPHGHLTYHDHGIELRFTGDVLLYVPLAGTARHFQGSGTVNLGPLFGPITAPAVFEADVEDNGEPGAGLDTFSIKIFGVVN